MDFSRNDSPELKPMNIPCINTNISIRQAPLNNAYLYTEGNEDLSMNSFDQFNKIQVYSHCGDSLYQSQYVSQ